ncbi:hypothetical protein GCM10010331_15430 [Streptomyces xanthochromogenes]|nr:hypothetical protein GCM10010331_15430 [Streptomyces xanthochromogenes]
MTDGRARERRIGPPQARAGREADVVAEGMGKDMASHEPPRRMSFPSGFEPRPAPTRGRAGRGVKLLASAASAALATGTGHSPRGLVPVRGR